jgi:putative lipoic acid-binding regulatory protein
MPSSNNKDASTLDVFSACADKGIAEYFKSTGTAAALAEWLHEETRLPTPVIKVCLKLLAQGLELGAKKKGAWLGRLAGQRIKGLVLSIPGLGDGFQRISEALGKLDKEAEAKRKFQEVLGGQKPANMAEFAQYLSLDLQTQLKELETLDEFRDEVRAALDSIQADLRHLLNPQPHLSLYLAPEDERYKFKFYTRWIPFLGRKKEQAALVSFLESDNAFSWWLTTGDAGSGKSRLALEFAMENSVGWRAGFLDASGDIDWRTWQPERPTLLISDYAFREPEVLRSVAKALAERQDLDCPVRLLLLERQAEGPWMDTFLGTPDRHRHAIEQAQFEEQFLALPPMAPEELKALCLVIIAKLKAPLPSSSVEEVLELMVRMGGRPLFVAFIADALARDGDPRKWDRDALLKDVLGREMGRWRTAGATDEDMTLLAFATMTGGLSVSDTGRAVEDAKGLLPGLDKRVAQVHSFMTGGPADELKPLEPDILGEAFVLDWLSPESELVALAASERADGLRKLAWRFSPSGMFGFLSRTAGDFPEHFLLAALAASVEGSEEQRAYWSMAATDLIGHIGNKQRDLATSLYEAQKRLAVEYEEPALREEQAKGAYNLLTIFCETGEVDRAEAFYCELAFLASEHPKEPALREEQGRGAFNLLNRYLQVGGYERGEALYQELAVLASKHPEEPALREQQARGAYNLLNGDLKAGGYERAEALYQELAVLASKHPEEPALRERQGKGAANLIGSLGLVGEYERAESLYQELAVLASAHPEEPAFREQQAMGAVNCILNLGKAGSLKEADCIYQELVALARSYPAEFCLPAFHLLGGKALVQLYVQANQLDAARSRQAELLRVCQSNSDIPQEIVDQLQKMVPSVKN